jgi:hypothetical protein
MLKYAGLVSGDGSGKLRARKTGAWPFCIQPDLKSGAF